MRTEEQQLSWPLSSNHPWTALLLTQLSRTMQTLLPCFLHDLQGGRGLQERGGEECFYLPAVGRCWCSKGSCENQEDLHGGILKRLVVVCFNGEKKKNEMSKKAYCMWRVAMSGNPYPCYSCLTKHQSCSYSFCWQFFIPILVWGLSKSNLFWM